MPVWAVKRKGENNEKLMKRAKKQVQAAGDYQIVRSTKYFAKRKTKRRVRNEALARSDFRTKRAKEKLYL